MRKILSSFILLMLSKLSFAGTVIALKNQEISVPVNRDLGSIFQFPYAVNTITPSKYFQISDVGSSIDPATGRKTDVRTFQIKPIFNAKTESITFVLVGGKNISIKFVPALGADKFYDVVFERTTKKFNTIFHRELQMMQSMILNDGREYSVKTLKKKVDAKFKEFKFFMTRVYESSDFTGYVFEVHNESKVNQKINLSKFSFGYPNKAILSHLDSEEITPCPFLGSEPRCKTHLYVVLHKMNNIPVSILSSDNPAPFMKRNPLNKDKGLL